jgi:signal transduction histidine kinase
LDVPEQFDWGPLLRIALGMALIGFVVLGFMLWRNRDLRHQLEERQRHQAAMEAAHTRVSRLSEERSDLLHMVAHDLRGPLMAFQTGVGLVNERTKISKDSDLTGVLTRMDRQTEAMQGLIDGLLDVEAIENGSRRLGRNPVNFRACVEVVIERFQPRAQSKGIEIEWSAPVGDLKVKGDMVAIRQVVENLVSNAVKYSPIGGRVAMRMVEEDNEIRFEVRDNGPGIAQDEFSRLFKKFSRLSAKPTDGESSHGMGLFIVKSLVDSMKGKVWCESQLGRGATFLVSFTQAG